MTSEWNEIPRGFYLMRRFHGSIGEHCLHLQLKVDEGPWYDQLHPPVYSELGSKDSKFWKWAEQNLPIYDHQEPVQPA